MLWRSPLWVGSRADVLCCYLFLFVYFFSDNDVESYEGSDGYEEDLWTVLPSVKQTVTEVILEKNFLYRVEEGVISLNNKYYGRN